MKKSLITSLIVGFALVFSSIITPATAGEMGPTLVSGQVIAAGGQLRTFPGIETTGTMKEIVFHLSGGSMTLKNIKMNVLFGTRVPSKVLLGNKLIDLTMEAADGEPVDTVLEYTVPSNYNSTGIFIKVPVVSEYLYDVILTNVGSSNSAPIYLTTWMVNE